MSAFGLLTLAGRPRMAGGKSGLAALRLPSPFRPFPPMLQIRFHYRAGPSWLHKYLTAAQISPGIWHSTNRQRRVEMKLLRVAFFAAATPPMPMLPMPMPDPVSLSSGPLTSLHAWATGPATGDSDDMMQVSPVANGHEATIPTTFMRVAEPGSVAVHVAVEADDWLVIDPELWDDVQDAAPRAASSASQAPQA